MKHHVDLCDEKDSKNMASTSSAKRQKVTETRNEPEKTHGQNMDAADAASASSCLSK